MIAKTHTLQVSYVAQVNDWACGAAVLEMVYRFYGYTNIHQNDILKKYGTDDPHIKDNVRIKTADMVCDARARGMHSSFAKTPLEREFVSELMELFIHTLGIPIIVCQQFSDKNPLVGHFRVVTGYNGSSVTAHDPHPEHGASVVYPLERFIRLWEPTGENVTGGIFIWIRKPDTTRTSIDRISCL